VAYIDYAKAFDTVSSVKLCHKLKAYGIAGNLLLWIKTSSLEGPSKPESVTLFLYEIKALTSGVILGSCLGPLLFVYILMTLLASLVTALHASYVLTTSKCTPLSKPILTAKGFSKP
jgi:hypothetical protein